MQNPQQHVLFGQDFGHILIGRVRAAMNDAIHIQIQMVKLRQQGIVGNNLVDFGITLGNPSVKLYASDELVRGVDPIMDVGMRAVSGAGCLSYWRRGKDIPWVLPSWLLSSVPKRVQLAINYVCSRDC